MLQKLKTHELTVGMYVVDTGLSWLEHPFLYSQEGEIRSTSAILEIIEAGYEEVFIDLEKGAFGRARASVPKDRIAALADAAARAAGLVVRDKIPLDQELPAASTLYADCLSIAKDILVGVRSGAELDVKASEALVDDVIASAVRNPDALIALSKLRRHDAYTFTHGVNVSVLAVAFGAVLGLEPDALRELGMAGLFHDLGKTGVPDAILNKPGRLTPDEFRKVKAHPELGRQLLEGRGVSEGVLLGVVEHHEKFDGSGYPKGLAGEDIHQWGRILGVADVYDALTSRRSYKDAMLPTRALGVLYGMCDLDFQSVLVERFIKFMGPYPVGSFVRLATGEYAFVRSANPVRTLFPELLVVFDQTRQPIRPRVIPADPEGRFGQIITAALDPALYGIAPLDYLKLSVD